MNRNYDARPFPTHAAIVAYWFQHTDEIKVDIDAACPKCWACGQDWNKRFWSKQAMPSGRTFTVWERAPLQRCHIVPRKLDGHNDPSNLFLMCNECHDVAPNTTDRSLFFEWVKNQDYSRRREKRLRQALDDFGLDSENLAVQQALLKVLCSAGFRSWIAENILCHWPQDKKCGSRLTESSVVAAFIAFTRCQSECPQETNEQPDKVLQGDPSKLMKAILAEISKSERHSHRERQTTRFAAMRSSRERRANYAPFGWECESLQERASYCAAAPKLLIPHAEEQAVLVRIFELIDLKHSTSQVAKFLNRHGMKPKGKPRYLPGGQPVMSKGIWYPSTVQSVLEHSELVDGTCCEVTNEGGRLSFHIVRQNHEMSRRDNTSTSPLQPKRPNAVNMAMANQPVSPQLVLFPVGRLK
jgi:Recombinase/HNH endonuclease